MKAVVISDIHGSGYYAEKIKEINERENPDKIILLGDLYYHEPRNELSQEYQHLSRYHFKACNKYRYQIS